MCEQRGIVTEATVADHIEPHRGNKHKFWFGELQSLCDSCHSGPKKQMEMGRPLGGCDIDGWPL